MRASFFTVAAWVALQAMVPAWAQSSSVVVYRCPGPSVTYTDRLTAQEARSRNCTALADLPVASAPAAAAAPQATAAGRAATPLGASPQAAAPTPDTRTRPEDQRARDERARLILEAELRREEARLQEARKAVGTVKAGGGAPIDDALIRRTESDIDAIRRELARLR
jgi:hypothetical protein